MKATILLLLVSSACAFSPIGFVPLFLLSKTQPTGPTPATICQKDRLFRRYGLLDEVMAERIGESANDGGGTLATSAISSPHYSSNNNSEFEELFHSLILSGDTRASISQQLDECCDEGFMEYISCSMMEKSSDEEERQGLQELILLIDQVQKEKEAAAAEQEQKIENDAKMVAAANLKKQQQADDEEQEIKDKVPIMMSNADVLKQANAIDQAVMTAVMTDDEKPSDFISDCREVVNLSGGFNNHGRMRVGGR